MPQAAKKFGAGRREKVRRDESQWASRQGKSRGLYNSLRWRGPHGLRLRQLRAQPLCQSCLKRGRLQAATEVDHIVPHREDMDLFYDSENLQSLCARCHNRKSATERAAMLRKSPESGVTHQPPESGVGFS